MLVWLQVPTSSTLKGRSRSASFLNRQKWKEFQRAFPVSPNEELIVSAFAIPPALLFCFFFPRFRAGDFAPGKKCSMNKEKGRLYVTNLHVGFRAKKARLWLEYSQVRNVYTEGNDLFIIGQNRNQVLIIAFFFCFRCQHSALTAFWWASFDDLVLVS